MTLEIYTVLFDDDLGALAEPMGAAPDAHETARTVGTVWARDIVTEIDDHGPNR